MKAPTTTIPVVAPRGAPAPPGYNPAAWDRPGRARHRKAGRTAQRAGADTEAMVQAALDDLDRRGEAHVVKQHPEVGIRKGRTTGIRSPASVDFLGSLRGGRCVGFDVKSFGEARAPLTHSGKATLKPHQKRELLALHNLGAVAGVLVALRVERHAPRAWYWTPIERWCELVQIALDAKSASIPSAHFEHFTSRVDRGLRLDLLPAWRAHIDGLRG